MLQGPCHDQIVLDLCNQVSYPGIQLAWCDAWGEPDLHELMQQLPPVVAMMSACRGQEGRVFSKYA